MREGTLDGVHRESLKVVKIPTECIGTLRELMCYRRFAHQAIVGVDHHAETQSAQHTEGVLGN